MSILTGKAIRDQIALGNIEIDPFDSKRVRTNSVDLTLGKAVRTYRSVTYMGCTDRIPSYEGEGTSIQVSRRLRQGEYSYGANNSKFDGILDSRQKNDVIQLEMDESGWVLIPGILYLMHTHERIHTKKFVTQLNGKSSIARLGIIVHFTAAYGDTGFNGQYTLEVSAMHPTIIYPGMSIAQAVFYTCEGEIEDYSLTGHYTGEAAKGAEPSHSYEQFEKL